MGNSFELDRFTARKFFSLEAIHDLISRRIYYLFSLKFTENKKTARRFKINSIWLESPNNVLDLFYHPVMFTNFFVNFIQPGACNFVVQLGSEQLVDLLNDFR